MIIIYPLVLTLMHVDVQAFLIAMAAILSERVGYDVRVQEAWDYFPWTVGKDTTPTTHCTHWTLMNDGNFCDSLHTLADAVSPCAALGFGQERGGCGGLAWGVKRRCYEGA